MADFCKRHSIQLFGKDFKELEGLCKKGEFVYVICESCGPTTVNHEGVSVQKCKWCGKEYYKAEGVTCSDECFEQLMNNSKE